MNKLKNIFDNSDRIKVLYFDIFVSSSNKLKYGSSIKMSGKDFDIDDGILLFQQDNLRKVHYATYIEKENRNTIEYMING